MVKNIFLSLFFVFFFMQCSAKIHIFGDSHASFCFSNERTAIPRNEHSFYKYTMQEKSIAVEFIIHWFESKTMFRIGRDGLGILNLKNFGVKNNDAAVFVFGEIDARCHIGKQCDVSKRALVEVIDTLARNFLETIQKNRTTFEKLYCVIVSVTPPTNNHYNWVYPYYGSIEDRVAITRQLNSKLKDLSADYGFDFLDIYSLYATSDGILDDNVGDGVVHVNAHQNDKIKQKLLNLLRTKYSLF